MPTSASPADASEHRRLAERLPVEFFARVWAPPHDLAASHEPMTEDCVVTSGGATIRGCAMAITGITSGRVRDGRLAECWVERAAWEAHAALVGA